MNPSDTSEEARKVQIQIYRSMSPAQKAALVFDAYETGKTLKMAGLRLLHPEASQKRIWHLWARQHLGQELYNEVYGEIVDE